MPRPVRNALAAGLSTAALLTLQGCGLPARYHAAQDVHAFFQAVQTDDRTAFEAHIDRPALRRDLRSQVNEAAAQAGFGGPRLQALLAGRAGDALVDQMISPEGFRVVWRRSGVSTERAPSVAEIVVLLKMTGPDEACLHDMKSGRCVLSFRNEDGTFKLAGIAARPVKAGTSARRS